MSHTGGCLCGAVRYTVDGPLRDILVCHCVECRRWAGRAWAATAVAAGDITIVGSVVWRPSPQSEWHARRGNCETCSSSLFWWAESGPRIAVGVGSLDDASGLEVAAHVWVEQGYAWERPPHGVVAYARGYPEDAPPLPWRFEE